MEYQEHEVHFAGNGVGAADRVVDALFQLRETLEIVGESDLLVAMMIMVAQCRINRNVVVYILFRERIARR